MKATAMELPTMHHWQNILTQCNTHYRLLYKNTDIDVKKKSFDHLLMNIFLKSNCCLITVY